MSDRLRDTGNKKGRLKTRLIFCVIISLPSQRKNLGKS